MGLFDKLKNIFIEEEVIGDSETPIKKKEEPVVVEEKKEEVKEESVTVPDINNVSDRSLTDTNQKFKFPIIFEDDDFKEEKKKSRSINVLERENTKYEPEVKKELKATKKVFKPSPVISPVYGILDKNYSKDDITSKDGLLNDSYEKVDIDYVIKKAYGEKKEDAYITREENRKNIDVEEKDIDLFIDKEDKIEEYTVDEIDEKIKSIDELLKDTNDDDFYSLVDSMYKEEEDDIE